VAADGGSFGLILALLPSIVFIASALYGFGATNTYRTYLGGAPYEPDGR